jgi:hypothetical protein
MRRRDFLRATLAMTAAGVAGDPASQPGPSNRAAVVIGIDKAGDLPKLRAARSGAHAVADWLASERFEVKRFVDDTQPVRAGEIFDAVAALVNRGTLEQLVVYFAGHGFINSYSEYWLLSQAPDNPNEAVSLIESVALAKQSAIPNVVFISDACRSRSDSLRTERVRGSLIFPNRGSSPNVVSDVDQFLATLVGDPSWEVSVAESAAAFEGIYTTAFLEAFRRPDDTMIATIGGAKVVPNTKLKPYLAREVPRRAQAMSIRTRQTPDTQVVSSDSTYIGHVTTAERTPAALRIATPSIIDLASAELQRVGAVPSTTAVPLSGDAMRALEADTGFSAARDTITQARGLPNQLAARTGFVVSGNRLASVTVSKRFKADFVNADAARPASAMVEVDLRNAPAASVALRFADGTGTVIAALDRFIGNVVAGEQGVSNVSYLPSRQNGMHSVYEQEEKRLNDLHAAVATAARFGAFRIEGERAARNRGAAQFADRIRILKGIDPTLGIYAAYAYADAALPEQVRSVRSFMRGDLQVDLFDVAMLAGALSGRAGGDSSGPFPFCPMLSQGWSLLRVKDVRLPEDVVGARDHLRAALWTTFDRDGMDLVERALLSDKVR